jgi:hypothetical protein
VLEQIYFILQPIDLAVPRTSFIVPSKFIDNDLFLNSFEIKIIFLRVIFPSCFMFLVFFLSLIGSFKDFINNTAAEGTTSTIACLFCTFNLHITRRPSQSMVAVDSCSPIFLGDSPSGPNLGASVETAPTCPPTVRMKRIDTELGSIFGGIYNKYFYVNSQIIIYVVLEKTKYNIINLASFISFFGKNEIFPQDEDTPGFKSYLSFLKNYQNKRSKNPTGFFILFIANFYTSFQNDNKISLLCDFLNYKTEKKEKIEISFENSCKIYSGSNLWGVLDFFFNFTKFGKISDLVWVNLLFSLNLNFEVVLFSCIFCSSVFQIFFFISHISLDYLFDLSLIEHSVSMEKNCIDFFIDLNGFSINIRNSPGSSNLVIDNISKIYYETNSNLKLKLKIKIKKNFLPFRQFKKLNTLKIKNSIISKIYIDITLMKSKIKFFPITKTNGTIVSKKNYFPRYLTLENKNFLFLENLIDPIIAKINSFLEISTNFINIIWYKIFFSTRHEIEHPILSLIFCEVVSIQRRSPKIKWVNLFIKLLSIFNEKIIIRCFENIVKKFSGKKAMLKSNFLLRFSYLHFLFRANSFHFEFKKNFLKENNKLIYFQELLDYKNRKSKKKIFSLNKIKVFSVIKVIENSIEKSKIIHKIDLEIYSLFLKFVGFNEILFLLIYFLSEIKKKLILSLTIEQLRRKNHKFQEKMRNKNSRYLLLKMVMKSSSKRIKLGKIAIIENLISLKLVHINYLPRALFEKKIFNHFFFNSDFETIAFFYNRVSEWKRTTRFDKKNLQSFLKISYKL